MSESKIDNKVTEVATDNPAIASSINKTLRFSEIHYRRLFETAQDGILILNAVTSKIEDANPFLIKIIGYSYEEPESVLNA